MMQEKAEKEAAIKNELEEINKTFYCDLCHKQYKKGDTTPKALQV